MARAIIIDPYEVLTDEAANEKEAIAVMRPLVAQAGVRVPESAIQDAEKIAVESFAPHFIDAVIFRLVNRDPALALKVGGQFQKSFNPAPKVRPEAGQIIRACKQAGLKVALAAPPRDEVINALQRDASWQLIDVKGPPPAMKIRLPDSRVLEFLVGALQVDPRDCLMLGTRLDRDVRPANILRMRAIHLRQGRYGQWQQPRDLKDVPDYTVNDARALLELIPRIQ